MTRPTQPNIVLVVADQLRADHLGCYGNPMAATPNIDSLATNGTKFDQFHAASVLCMPNRSTILTGRLPSVHGVRRNGIPLPQSQRTFPQQLAAAGYRTALIGKAHFQHYGQFASGAAGPNPNDQVRRAEPPTTYEMELIDRWKSEPDHRAAVPYYGFDHVELCLGHGDRVEGDYARWLNEKSPGIEQRRGPDSELPGNQYLARDSWRTAVPEELYSSAYIADRSEDWLRNHAEHHDDKPFFMMCSFPDPHHPFTPPGRFWDMFDPRDVVLPETFRNRSTSPFIEFIHKISSNGTLPNSHIPFAAGEREAREILALTFGSIANLDQAVGKIRAAVGANGFGRDTIVVFTSDHGDMMGDHGVFLKAPMHFCGLSRVPFLVADPFDSESRVVDDVGGSLDIAKTILAAAGVHPLIGMQGRDLLDRAGSGSGGVMIENESAGIGFGRPGPFRLRTLRTNRWRLTISNDPGLCELYDVQADPGEVNNLWLDSRLVETRLDLLAELTTNMIDHAEVGLSPWSAA